MKNKLQLVLVFGFLFGVAIALKGQDTLAIRKRNIIFLVPTSVFGNMFDVDAIWLHVGYDYRISNRKIIGVAFGKDLYAGATGGGGLFGGYSSDRTKGYNINIVYKLIVKKRFYYATNIFWQDTKTNRSEEFYNGSDPYYHSYSVRRYMTSVIPEVGFVFIDKCNFFADVGMGLGIKYVYSKTFGKTGPLSTSDKESFSNKYVEFGGVVEPRLFFQYQFGYCF